MCEEINIYEDLIELRYIDSENEEDSGFDVMIRGIIDFEEKEGYDLDFNSFDAFLRFGELLALYCPKVSLNIIRERWEENDEYELEVTDYNLNCHRQTGGFSEWNRYTNYKRY